MKALKLLFTTAVIAATPFVTHAEDIDVRRHIEVQGTAKLYGDVDKAIWDIKIRGEANALEEASNLLETSVVNLQNELEAKEIGKDSLRLSGISSGRVHEQVERSGPRVFKGFYAERRAVIEIPDLELREQLERILLADDRVEIVRVHLKTTKHEELRKQSLISAVAAAKAKAEFLAKEAGAQLGLVLSITEGAESRYGGYANLTENRIEMPVFGQAAGTPEFEKLDYSGTVAVKFELR